MILIEDYLKHCGWFVEKMRDPSNSQQIIVILLWLIEESNKHWNWTWRLLETDFIQLIEKRWRKYDEYFWN